MNKTPWDWRTQVPSEWLPDGMMESLDGSLVDEQMGKLRGFMEMQQVYRAAISEITTKLQTLDSEFSVRYAHNPIHHIDSRLKAPNSILEKLRRKGFEPTIEAAREHLQDIAGVRVVCNYLEDIYDIAQILERQSDITPVRRSDYIAHPKENGYRSLHLIVRVPVFLSDHTESVPVEIQIRTIAMDFWATLEHELRYKAPTDIEGPLGERLKACAEVSAGLDLEMQSIRNQIIPGDKPTTS